MIAAGHDAPFAWPRPVRALALGASWGGVEALMALVPALPRGLRAGVLVVLHQPRDGAGVLAELLAARSAVPVREAVDKDRLEPGHVLVAPADYHLLVDHPDAGDRAAGAVARVVLSVDAPVHFSRPSIDLTFESAAHVFGPGLAAALLTGASHDGAAGLQAVRAAGGLALVQDPDDARADAMPRAALAAGPVDAVLSLARLGRALSLLETSP